MSRRIRAAQNLQEPPGDELAQVLVAASDVDMLVFAGPIGDRQAMVGSAIRASIALDSADCRSEPIGEPSVPGPAFSSATDQRRASSSGTDRVIVRIGGALADSTSGSHRRRFSRGRRRVVSSAPSKSMVPPSLISRYAEWPSHMPRSCVTQRGWSPTSIFRVKTP